MPQRSIEYKSRLPEYLLRLIREFRAHPTPVEDMLWECLRDRRLNGFKFRRQHPIGRYVVDFYCHASELIIELDGDIHNAPDQQEYDQVRETELKARHLTILRFRNERIINELDRVLEEIASQQFITSGGRTEKQKG